MYEIIICLIKSSYAGDVSPDILTGIPFNPWSVIICEGYGSHSVSVCVCVCVYLSVTTLAAIYESQVRCFEVPYGF